MNILHLLISGGLGGIETLCKNIVLTGKEKHYLCFLWEGGPVAEQLARQGKTVFLLGEKVYSSVGKKFEIEFEKWNDFNFHYKEFKGVYYVPVYHPSYIYVYKRKRVEDYISGIEKIINDLL